MRKMARLLNISWLIAVFPAAVSAQDLNALCESVTRLGPGQWVEYAMTAQRGMPGPMSMWMGNVGNEDRSGVSHVVYEMRLSGPQTMTMQMLVTEDNGPWDMQNVVEIKMQMPGQPPMVMSGSMLDMARQQAQTPNIAEECLNAEVIGNESVTVPAGTMQTLHLRVEEGEAWTSMDVPLALVKFVSSDGSMELKAHGDGATRTIN